MKTNKLIAGITYFLSWGVCLLPNTPVHGQVYDEPQDDKILKQIITPPPSDVLDTTCGGYTHDVSPKIELEDLSQYERTIRTLDEDIGLPYNPDDYDSGDY